MRIQGLIIWVVIFTFWALMPVCDAQRAQSPEDPRSVPPQCGPDGTPCSGTLPPNLAWEEPCYSFQCKNDECVPVLKFGTRCKADEQVNRCRDRIFTCNSSGQCESQDRDYTDCCGNGRKDGQEECDGSPGCSADCKLPTSPPDLIGGPPDDAEAPPDPPQPVTPPGCGQCPSGECCVNSPRCETRSIPDGDTGRMCDEIRSTNSWGSNCCCPPNGTSATGWQKCPSPAVSFPYDIKCLGCASGFDGGNCSGNTGRPCTLTCGCTPCLCGNNRVDEGESCDGAIGCTPDDQNCIKYECSGCVCKEKSRCNTDKCEECDGKGNCKDRCATLSATDKCNVYRCDGKGNCRATPKCTNPCAPTCDEASGKCMPLCDPLECKKCVIKTEYKPNGRNTPIPEVVAKCENDLALFEEQCCNVTCSGEGVPMFGLGDDYIRAFNKCEGTKASRCDPTERTCCYAQGPGSGNYKCCIKKCPSDACRFPQANTSCQPPPRESNQETGSCSGECNEPDPTNPTKCIPKSASCEGTKPDWCDEPPPADEPCRDFVATPMCGYCEGKDSPFCQCCRALGEY